VNQADLLRWTIELLESQRIDYLVVGSIGSMLFGEPRLTMDIELRCDATKLSHSVAPFTTPSFT
jgi:hypothetical protein